MRSFYHEISIIRQKNNKNRKICDNIIEMPFLCFKAGLEIQLDDTPGYPIVKRGFYYCGRMISEQYGTVFVDEHYEKIEKVYSIWICPDPAKKRKNGIFKYHTVEDIIYGEPYTKEANYDLMEVVVLNLGDADKSSDLAILDLLNVLFSTTTTPEEKKQRLHNEFEIAMTVELKVRCRRCVI